MARQLLARCLCGAAVGERIERGAVSAIRCACGVARLLTDRSEEDLGRQYASGDYHRADDRHAGCTPYAQRYEHDFKVAARRWRRYSEVLGGRLSFVSTALDVGCANGAFVDFLSTQHVFTWGLDPSPEFERETILRGTTADLPLHDMRRTYDLITYHDVLEHLVDPEGEVRRAAGLLGPRGVLILDVPDVWGGAGEHHWKPEHLWYFTQDALAEMLGAAGLTLLASDRPIPGKLVVYAEAA